MSAYTEELNEPEQFHTFTKGLNISLDSKYKKADLHKVMENQSQHLTEVQQNELLNLLQKYEDFSIVH